ncbi:MAG: sigma-54 interaction domain-containing protein [Clostridia bacterium]
MLPNFNHSLFEQILNNLTDGICISDKYGTTLWVNKARASMCQVPQAAMVGRNASDLEKDGIFNPSATRLTLESGKTVSTVQEMKNGRKFLVTGHLIRNEQGEIDVVVAHSRDITEAVRTSTQLEETEMLLRRYSQEIVAMKLDHQKESSSGFSIVGRSDAYRSLMNLVDKVAEVDTTVLITGETGVGKSVIAKRIHHLSQRHDKPFLQINCGAIPETLLESELFGYKKGAFSGANPDGKAGLVKMADKGTLFLDEIGELPLHLQSKILQLLQEKTYIPIGDTQPQTVDVRIITATNRNLADMLEEKTFRADLYYRLNILPIHVPALHERQEDILSLLYHNLNKCNERYKKNRTFAPKTLQLLQNYHWPGNIRELENLIERLVITAMDDDISPEDLPEKIRRDRNDEGGHLLFLPGESLSEMVERMERDVIVHAYQRHQSTRQVARSLGITQSSLMRRLKKYGIRVESTDAE